MIAFSQRDRHGATLHTTLRWGSQPPSTALGTGGTGAWARPGGPIRMVVAVLCVVGLGASRPVCAAESAPVTQESLDIVRRLAIQHNGRHKPFDSFARETLEHITGVRRMGREDPVGTVLSIMADPERWQAKPLVAVPFRPLRQALGMDAHTARISYNDLVATRTLMRLLPPIVQKQQRDEKLSIAEQETMDAFERFATLSNLLEQKLEFVPPASSTQHVWVPILDPKGYAPQQAQGLRDAWTEFIGTVRAQRTEGMVPAARHLAEVLANANPPIYPARWRLSLEVFYNHSEPFRIAQLLYVLAWLGLVLGFTQTARWGAVAGMGALVMAGAVHAAGIMMRVVLGGRPPVANFYETMLWLPFVAVVLSLIFEWRYRTRYFGIAAAILATIMLALADAVPLDSSISPVVAVLRSNLWLTVHVLTIVASYGALALATVLAHLYGWLYLVQRTGRHASLEGLDILLYRGLQVGVVLLAGGIMLGAVWANASWGRYWGWDPKETWALITLLWFLAVLHGRFAGWLRGIGVALSTIAGFALLLMTYYGVSFYLVGLHSYAGGHAKPLPPLLIAYGIVEVAFIVLVGLATLRRRRAA